MKEESPRGEPIKNDSSRLTSGRVSLVLSAVWLFFSVVAWFYCLKFKLAFPATVITLLLSLPSFGSLAIPYESFRKTRVRILGFLLILSALVLMARWAPFSSRYQGGWSWFITAMILSISLFIFIPLLRLLQRLGRMISQGTGEIPADRIWIVWLFTSTLSWMTLGAILLSVRLLGTVAVPRGFLGEALVGVLALAFLFRTGAPASRQVRVVLYLASAALIMAGSFVYLEANLLTIDLHSLRCGHNEVRRLLRRPGPTFGLPLTEMVQKISLPGTCTPDGIFSAIVANGIMDEELANANLLDDLAVLDERFAVTLQTPAPGPEGRYLRGLIHLRNALAAISAEHDLRGASELKEAILSDPEFALEARTILSLHIDRKDLFDLIVCDQTSPTFVSYPIEDAKDFDLYDRFGPMSKMVEPLIPYSEFYAARIMSVSDDSDDAPRFALVPAGTFFKSSGRGDPVLSQDTQVLVLGTGLPPSPFFVYRTKLEGSPLSPGERLSCMPEEEETGKGVSEKLALLWKRTPGSAAEVAFYQWAIWSVTDGLDEKMIEAAFLAHEQEAVDQITERFKTSWRKLEPTSSNADDIPSLSQNEIASTYRQVTHRHAQNLMDRIKALLSGEDPGAVAGRPPIQPSGFGRTGRLPIVPSINYPRLNFNNQLDVQKKPLSGKNELSGQENGDE